MAQLFSLHAYWTPVRSWIFAHKVWSGVIIVLVLGGGWILHGKLTSTTGQMHYVLGTVASSTIIASVSESGQVDADNQLDIKPKVSGDVVYVPVKAGQKVTAGTLLLELDDTDAQKTVRDAEANLTSAEISLKKQQEPADTLTMTQAQNAVTNASTALSTTYSNSINDISSTFLDVPDIESGIQDVIIGTETNRAAQWNVDYYKNEILNFNPIGGTYRDDAYNKYISAKAAYDKAQADFKSTSLTIQDTATTERLLAEAYATTQTLSDAAKSANGIVQLYEDTMKTQGRASNTVADTELTNLASYTSKLNSHLATLLADTNQLTTNKQNILVAQQSLTKTTAGADPLDVQSTQLSVTKAQNALTDAKNTLADYYIRAPFDGTLASVSVKKFDPAGSGAAVATIVTADQIAQLSVNEVDAAKIQVGQKATLTFDAIDGLSIAGNVASVDTIGTVSQGVVSYSVKINFITQDPRVKPGMTVNAQIITDTAQDALSVPSSAVKTTNGSSYVQAFQPELTDTGGGTGITTTETPVNIPVTIGISDDTNVQIISGLTLGQQIITKTTSATAASSAATRTTGGTNRGATGGFGGGGIRL